MSYFCSLPTLVSNPYPIGGELFVNHIHPYTKRKLPGRRVCPNLQLQEESMKIFRTGLVFIVAIALFTVTAWQPEGCIDALGQRMDSLD